MYLLSKCRSRGRSFFEMAEHPLATACVSGFDPAVQGMIRPWNNATSGKSAFFLYTSSSSLFIIILSSIAFFTPVPCSAYGAVRLFFFYLNLQLPHPLQTYTMYRPRPRSRSPDRTQRAYSPSRPLSPPPPRYDRYPPRRHDDYPPYPAPDSRRYGGYPPETSDYPKNQSIGYEEPYYRRRHEEPYPGYEYMDEPGYAPPLREQNEREYDDWGSGGRGYEPRGRNWGRGYDRGMAIDREEFPSRRDVDSAHEQWERGRDPELAVSA